MSDDKILIRQFNNIRKLSISGPYKKLTARQRYKSLFNLYPELAQAHPVVFKLVTEEHKFNVVAFKKYMRLYRKNDIKPEIMPELGSTYMMYLEEENLKRHNKRPNRADLYKYKRDCMKIMKDDMKKLTDLQKEERDNYKKREEERLERNRAELKEFFKKLKEDNDNKD